MYFVCAQRPSQDPSSFPTASHKTRSSTPTLQHNPSACTTAASQTSTTASTRTLPKPRSSRTPTCDLLISLLPRLGSKANRRRHRLNSARWTLRTRLPPWPLRRRRRRFASSRRRGSECRFGRGGLSSRQSPLPRRTLLLVTLPRGFKRQSLQRTRCRCRGLSRMVSRSRWIGSQDQMATRAKASFVGRLMGLGGLLGTERGLVGGM